MSSSYKMPADGGCGQTLIFLDSEDEDGDEAIACNDGANGSPDDGGEINNPHGHIYQRSPHQQTDAVANTSAASSPVPESMLETASSSSALSPAVLDAARKALSSHLNEFKDQLSKQPKMTVEEDDDIQVEYESIKRINRHTVPITLNSDVRREFMKAVRKNGKAGVKLDEQFIKGLLGTHEGFSVTEISLFVPEKRRKSDGSKENESPPPPAALTAATQQNSTAKSGGRSLKPDERALLTTKKEEASAHYVRPAVPKVKTEVAGKKTESLLVATSSPSIPSYTKSCASVAVDDKKRKPSESPSFGAPAAVIRKSEGAPPPPPSKKPKQSYFSSSSSKQDTPHQEYFLKFLEESRPAAPSSDEDVDVLGEARTSPRPQPASAPGPTGKRWGKEGTEEATQVSRQASPSSLSSARVKPQVAKRTRRRSHSSIVDAANLTSQRRFLRSLRFKVVDGVAFVPVASFFDKVFSGFVVDLGSLLRRHPAVMSRHLLFDGWRASHVSLRLAEKILAARGGKRKPQVPNKCLRQLSLTGGPTVKLDDYDRGGQRRKSSEADASKFLDVLGLCSKDRADEIRSRMPGAGIRTRSIRVPKVTSASFSMSSSPPPPSLVRQKEKQPVEDDLSCLGLGDPGSILQRGRTTPLFRPARTACNAGRRLEDSPSSLLNASHDRTLAMEKKGISLPPGWKIVTLQPPPASKYKYISPDRMVFRSLGAAFQYSKLIADGNVAATDEGAIGSNDSSIAEKLAKDEKAAKKEAAAGEARSETSLAPVPSRAQKVVPEAAAAGSSRLLEIARRQKKVCRKFAGTATQQSAPKKEEYLAKKKTPKRLFPRPTLPGLFSLGGLCLAVEGSPLEGWFTRKVSLLKHLAEPRRKSAPVEFPRIKGMVKKDRKEQRRGERIRVKFSNGLATIDDLAEWKARKEQEEEGGRDNATEEEAKRLKEEERKKNCESSREVAARIEQATTRTSKVGRCVWRQVAEAAPVCRFGARRVSIDGTVSYLAAADQKWVNGKRAELEMASARIAEDFDADTLRDLFFA